MGRDSNYPTDGPLKAHAYVFGVQNDFHVSVAPFVTYLKDQIGSGAGPDRVRPLLPDVNRTLEYAHALQTLGKYPEPLMQGLTVAAAIIAQHYETEATAADARGRSRVERVEAQLESAQTRHMRVLADATAAHDKCVSELRADLATAQADLTALRTQLDRAAHELTARSAAHEATLTAQNAAHTAALATQRAAADEEVSRLRSELSAARADAATARESVMVAREAAARAETQARASHRQPPASDSRRTAAHHDAGRTTSASRSKRRSATAKAARAKNATERSDGKNASDARAAS